MNDMEWGASGDAEGPFLAGQQEAQPKRVAVDPEEEMAVVHGLFWSYVQDFERHRGVMEARIDGAIEAEDLKAAVKAARDVRDAISLLFEERNRVEKLRREIAGGVGGGALDLDAARDEIGRRLACLRRAAGG
ncbi:permease [Paracoccus caeni]|uniref:Permease n=1 Tax=Paracoccus caeni TaxID=657651 RepID=A0A934SI07_9RHOB|nr:permease [Paracoccus caeni]MBK4217839.1 permease [Paracoccus caeni]